MEMDEAQKRLLSIYHATKDVRFKEAAIGVQVATELLEETNSPEIFAIKNSQNSLATQTIEDISTRDVNRISLQSGLEGVTDFYNTSFTKKSRKRRSFLKRRGAELPPERWAYSEKAEERDDDLSLTYTFELSSQKDPETGEKVPTQLEMAIKTQYDLDDDTTASLSLSFENGKINEVTLSCKETKKERLLQIADADKGKSSMLKRMLGKIDAHPYPEEIRLELVLPGLLTRTRENIDMGVFYYKSYYEYHADRDVLAYEKETSWGYNEAERIINKSPFEDEEISAKDFIQLTGEILALIPNINSENYKDDLGHLVFLSRRAGPMNG